MSRNTTGHIKWDEEVIAEHDKERGTRQKIDEPPTPYHYGDMEAVDGFVSDSEVMLNGTAYAHAKVHSVDSNWTALQAKLAYEAIQHMDGPTTGTSEPMDVAEHDERLDEEKRKHAAFVAKRESHYNEFKVLQALREKHALEDNDDDV